MTDGLLYRTGNAIVSNAEDMGYLVLDILNPMNKFKPSQISYLLTNDHQRQKLHEKYPHV